MRTTRPLTDYMVKMLKPARDQTKWTEIPDGGCRGLMLRLSPRGEKVWAVRVVVNKQRQYQTIGAYPAVTLAEARKRVAEYISAARESISPESLDAKKRAKSMSLTEAHHEYVEAVRSSLHTRTVQAKLAMFRDHIAPIAGNRLLRKIRRADIVEVVESVRRKGFPTQGNRVLSEFMALLHWAEEHEWIDGVPTVRRKTVGTRERPRDRTLSDNELKELWKISGQIGELSGDLLRLILLTGQRRDDVRLMVWEEIDLNTATWVIPGARYKTGVDHVVPLSTGATDILKRRLGEEARGFVLPGRAQGQPFAGQASLMRRVRTKMDATFTLHDLRRTCRTRMSRLGVDERTAEAVLGHLPSGILKTYDRYDRLDEKRDALNRWAEHVLMVVGERGGNVVSIAG